MTDTLKANGCVQLIPGLDPGGSLCVPVRSFDGIQVQFFTLLENFTKWKRGKKEIRLPLGLPRTLARTAL